MITLNRAVAVGMAFGPEVGLRELEELEAEVTLRDYHPLALARADMLRRLDRRDEARATYVTALRLCGNSVERSAILHHLTSLE